MPTSVEAVRPTVNEILHEKLDAILADCDAIATNPQFLNTLEALLFTKQHELFNEILQAKLQERIEAAEQEPEAKTCPQCKKKLESKTPNRKQ